MRRRLAEIAVLVFFVAVVVLTALTLTITYKAAQDGNARSKEIQALITTGHSAVAENALAARKASVLNSASIKSIDTLLHSAIFRSEIDRRLICSIAETTHLTSAVIATYCP